MTLAEFHSFMDGFRRFNGGGDDDAPPADMLRVALAEEALRNAGRK